MSASSSARALDGCEPGDARFQLLVESAREYAIVTLDTDGRVKSSAATRTRLKAEHARLAPRAVAVTGGAFLPAEAAFLERSADPRLAKPYEPEAVRAILLSALR